MNVLMQQCSELTREQRQILQNELTGGALARLEAPPLVAAWQPVARGCGGRRGQDGSAEEVAPPPRAAEEEQRVGGGEVGRKLSGSVNQVGQILRERDDDVKLERWNRLQRRKNILTKVRREKKMRENIENAVLRSLMNSEKDFE